MRSSKSSPPRRRDGGLVGDERASERTRVGIAATSTGETPSSTLSREMTVSSRRRSASSAHGATSARTAARSAMGSTATPASRRISRPSAWKVRTRTAPGATPERRDGRIQPLGHLDRRPLVEGDRRIASGGVPVAMSQAARATSVVVLPLPAGATHSDGPGGAVAAARWSGARRREPRFDVRMHRPDHATGPFLADHPRDCQDAPGSSSHSCTHQRARRLTGR